MRSANDGTTLPRVQQNPSRAYPCTNSHNRQFYRGGSPALWNVEVFFTFRERKRAKALAKEVLRAMDANVPLLLAHEMNGIGQEEHHPCDFDAFFANDSGATYVSASSPPPPPSLNASR